MSPPAWRHPLAAVGLGLLALALWERLGYFTWPALATLVVALLVLGIASILPEREPRAGLIGQPLVLLLLLPLAAVSTPGPVPSISVAFMLAIPIFLVCTAWPMARPWRLPLTAAALIAAHAAMLAHMPHPAGQDVFVFLNRGVDTLLRGHNPYAPVVRVDGDYVFTYPPGVLLLGGPFRVLFGDVRWAYLVAEGLSVLLLRSLARRLGRDTTAPWLDALILLPLALPRISLAFYDFSNHELLLVLLGLAGLRLALARRRVAAALALGVGIAAKQYFVTFPVLFLAAFLDPVVLALSAVVAAAVTLPFLAWNPGAMLHNLFGQLSAPPDTSRLTLYAGADRLGLRGSAVVRALSLSGTAVMLLLAWLSRRDLGAAIRACGLALALFALTSPFAAYNYYGYAFWLLCWGFLVPTGWNRARIEAGAKIQT